MQRENREFNASGDMDTSATQLNRACFRKIGDPRKDPRGHMVLIVVAAMLPVGAIALVAYLLWPTWGANPADGPERLPVSVGTTLFNVPTSAIRRKIQRHSGPQERVDLSFVFPSLEAPEAPRHVSADLVEEGPPQPIDRI